MDTETQKINLLVEIVEHLLVADEGGPIDPVAKASCIGAYVRLCSLTRDESVDRYITSPPTGKLFNIHFPANPEGFMVIDAIDHPSGYFTAQDGPIFRKEGRKSA